MLLNPLIGTKQFTVECKNLQCVEDTIKQAEASKHVQRIRIFNPGNEPLILNNTSAQTFFPADVDIYIQ